jgi:hypothetical protein
MNQFVYAILFASTICFAIALGVCLGYFVWMIGLIIRFKKGGNS